MKRKTSDAKQNIYKTYDLEEYVLNCQYKNYPPKK